MKRVVALTGGKTVASARFRVGQFVGRLESWGIDLEERASRVGSFPPVARWKRPGWLAATLLDRVPDVVASHRHDVVLLQRELVSTLYTIEGLTRRPRVLDVDDAIWVHRRGAFAAKLASRCDRVIAGNAFLAEYFARLNRDVVLIPTAVDTARFTPRAAPEPPHLTAPRTTSHGCRPGEDDVIIGWSGSSAGFPYLAMIDDALAAVVRERPRVRIRLLADAPRAFAGVSPDRVEFIPWSPDREVGAIQGMDIGLMPLVDSDWERGKCSFKMLLYLACGAPAVVSPVGMNQEVLAGAACGRAARTTAEWRDALIDLVDAPADRRALGAAGRAMIEARYSWAVIAPRLAGALAR